MAKTNKNVAVKYKIELDVEIPSTRAMGIETPEYLALKDIPVNASFSFEQARINFMKNAAYRVRKQSSNKKVFIFRTINKKLGQYRVWRVKDGTVLATRPAKSVNLGS